MGRLSRALVLSAIAGAAFAACSLDSQGTLGLGPDGGVVDGGGGFAGVSGECFANSKVCNGKCVSETDPATGCGATGCEPCSFQNAEAKCSGDLCDMAGCQPGFADCGGGTADGCETNLDTHPLNCGACGSDCTVKGETWTVCKGGVCKESFCPVGKADCDFDEVCETDTTSDVQNCKFCGVPCSFPNATAACESSACVMKACDPGWADCDGNPLNGCEVNTTSDKAHCGACGKTCQAVNALTECQNSVCKPACSAGYGSCDGNPDNGCETPLDTTSNCGSCGKACTTGVSNASPACQGGNCTFTCNGGLTKCGNVCLNTQTSVNNCGSCGNQCTSAPPGGSPACLSGTCSFNCGGGTTKCGTLCKNTTNDPQNCGSCGNGCPEPPNSTAFCSSSTCGFNCTGGLTKCGSVCLDTDTDMSNCGSCGAACNIQNASGAFCNNGSCDFGDCFATHGNCDGNRKNGCETPLGTNSNCSSCGDSCKSPKTCQDGGCKN